MDFIFWNWFWTDFKSKGCLQIPVPSQWYVPISIVLCEMDIHRASLVVHRATHTARILTRSPGGNMNCPSRIPTCWCTFLNCKWFSKVRVTSQFSCFMFVFSADPGDGYIPRRRTLDPEHCKYHVNSLCACLTGMYPSRNSRFFSFFFPKKNVENILKIRRIELIRKAEPPR